MKDIIREGLLFDEVGDGPISQTGKTAAVFQDIFDYITAGEQRVVDQIGMGNAQVPLCDPKRQVPQADFLLEPAQELMELFQVIRVGGQRDAGHQRQLGTAGGRGDKMVWLPRMEIDLDLSGLPYHAVALGAKKVRRYSLFQCSCAVK